MKKFRIYIWEDIKDDEMFKDIVKNNKERVNDYFNVIVSDNYEEMYDIVDKIELSCENFNKTTEKNYGGRTLLCRKQLYEDDNDEIYGYSKAQGFIFLCEKQLTFNTISHEVAHAVLGYFGAYFNDKLKYKRYDQRENDDDILHEELFCYITGSLNNQICVRF